MAEDRLFRVIVLGGMALVGAAPAAAGCTPADAPGEGTLVPQSQTVVLPEATAPAGSASAAPIIKAPPPPPRNTVPIDPVAPVNAGAAPPPVDAGAPPPPLDAGSDGGFHLKPPREGPPPRPRLGF